MKVNQLINSFKMYRFNSVASALSHWPEFPATKND